MFAEIANKGTGAGVVAERKRTAYELAEQRRQKVWQDLQQYRADARTLGYGDERTVAWLRDASVPAKFILSVLDGQYVPASPTNPDTNQDLLEALNAKPENERMRYFLQTVLQRPAFAQAYSAGAWPRCPSCPTSATCVAVISSRISGSTRGK